MRAEKQRRRPRLVSPPAPAGVRLIRKYGNRRLYDTHTSRYVTLGDLVEVFAGEEEVKVVDAVSGEDLTKRVLAQAILFEEDRRRLTILPTALLRGLLRHRGEATREGYDRKIAKLVSEFSSTRAAAGAESGGDAGSATEMDELKR